MLHIKAKIVENHLRWFLTCSEIIPNEMDKYDFRHIRCHC